MNTQAEVYKEMKELIPTELWEKYSYLSFENMAEIPELESYKAKLLQAEKDLPSYWRGLPVGEQPREEG